MPGADEDALGNGGMTMDYRKEIPYDAFGDHAPIEGKSTEGDYISREAAIRALEFRCKILTVRGGKTAADILTRYGIKTIRNRDGLPAADVRPVNRTGCPYCTKQKVIAWDLCNDGIVLESDGRIRMLSGGDWGCEINYCPMCGRLLRENQSLNRATGEDNGNAAQDTLMSAT